VAAIREHGRGHLDIEPRRDAFDTLTIPLRQTHGYVREYWRRDDTRYVLAFSLAVFAPGAIVLSAMGIARARRLEAGGAVRAVAIGLTVGATTSPLLLHVIGWDLHRWNALSAVNALLAALILLRSPVPSRAFTTARRLRRRTIALLVTGWGVAADPIFFDGYTPEHPPFVRQIRFLVNALQTGDRAMWIPDR
jgi:MFS family permease